MTKHAFVYFFNAEHNVDLSSDLPSGAFRVNSSNIDMAPIDVVISAMKHIVKSGTPVLNGSVFIYSVCNVLNPTQEFWHREEYRVDDNLPHLWATVDHNSLLPENDMDDLYAYYGM